jgi:hypothetical protein
MILVFRWGPLGESQLVLYSRPGSFCRNGCVIFVQLSTGSVLIRTSLGRHMIVIMKGGKTLEPWYLMYVLYVRINIFEPDREVQIRNLSRMIWINVAIPPPQSDVPTNLKGKVQPSTDLTAAQLRRKKVDVVKLCLAFAFAVKHYLRGEDGMEWDDYLDVIPAHLRSGVHNCTTTNSSRSSSYAAVLVHQNTSVGSMSKPRTASPDHIKDDNGRCMPDATKRIRVKRSSHTISSSTPLLKSGNDDDHRVIDVHADVTIPLPLM